MKKIPKSLAQVADLLYETKNARLEQQKKVEELEKFESQLKNHLIDNLKKGDANGIQGKVCRVSIVPKEKPAIVTEKDGEPYDGWKDFYAYVKKNNAFELLQRRLNETAIKERWENKKNVPGVRTFTVLTVSMNKV